MTWENTYTTTRPTGELTVSIADLIERVREMRVKRNELHTDLICTTKSLDALKKAAPILDHPCGPVPTTIYGMPVWVYQITPEALVKFMDAKESGRHPILALMVSGRLELFSDRPPPAGS